MNHIKYLLALAFMLVSTAQAASPELVFYLQKPPLEVLSSLKGTLTKKEIADMNPGGFLALYSGYADYSNQDGMVAFPLHSNIKKPIQLLITTHLKLVRMSTNTIGYEVLPPKNTRATLYTYERRQDKYKFWYWHVSQKDVALGKALKNKPVILLTDPENIYVATGDFQILKPSTSAILPNNLYVINNEDNARRISNSLNMQRFFEPTEIKTRVPTPLIHQEIIEN
jgi:hypothetical protein